MSAPERESMDYDVVIVGAGPAGLSAAIRLKQIDPDLEVVVLEKGSEVGAHILSGAVIDPMGLDALIPDWREKGAPVTTEVSEDRFFVLGQDAEIRIPNMLMPPLMNNHGNYIVSLGNVCRWLGEQAEALGVEIFPGFAASALVEGENGEIAGVIAGEYGLNKDREPGPDYEPGMELRGKYVMIAEGVRGSLARQVIAKFALDADSEPQKFGLGMKELWEVDPAKFKQGQVTHTMGWPLDSSTGGGSFMYHLADNQVYVGFVVHLNYENPYLSPYQEFQRFKHHPEIDRRCPARRQAHLLWCAGDHRRRLSIGAKARSSRAALLIGCSAGFVNVPRIKGSHNAMLSGKLAAEAAAAAIAAGRSGDTLDEYRAAFDASPIKRDLYRVRNVKPFWSKFGLWGGLAAGGREHVDQPDRRYLLRHAGAWQERRGGDPAGGDAHPDRLPQTRWRPVLRPADQCRLQLHQP